MPPVVSLIETFPTEILEKLLLYSNNINFPLSSHVIGRNVGTPKAFRAMSMRIIFFSEIEESKIKSEQDLWSNPDDIPRCKLLAGKFMTFDRFKEYMEIYLGTLHLPYCKLTPDTVSQIVQFLHYSDQKVNGKHYFIENHEILGRDLSAALAFDIKLPDFTGTRLPNDLLQPPFTDEKIRTLHMRLRLNASATSEQRSAIVYNKNEVTDAALVHPNPMLIACFVSTPIGLPITTGLIRKVVCDLGAPLTTLNVLLKSKYMESPIESYWNMKPADRSLYAPTTHSEIKKIEAWADEQRNKSNRKALTAEVLLMERGILNYDAGIAYQIPLSEIDLKTPTIPEGVFPGCYVYTEYSVRSSFDERYFRKGRVPDATPDESHDE
ncbi:hypothetical protein BS50DRAFT_618524 [Corynespora cassiicola Philippines]|uniref:Uncharacterized protein n=1 Tax=Corynespora cassiicola Philippines TaxID=1448308 RepID=A0A2T2P1H4_CORCC|nr:hypothetical protein BS50DRAFT_618524 [Corynespora cassiicola Philippines]